MASTEGVADEFGEPSLVEATSFTAREDFKSNHSVDRSAFQEGERGGVGPIANGVEEQRPLVCGCG